MAAVILILAIVIIIVFITSALSDMQRCWSCLHLTWQSHNEFNDKHEGKNDNNFNEKCYLHKCSKEDALVSKISIMGSCTDVDHLVMNENYKLQAFIYLTCNLYNNTRYQLNINNMKRSKKKKNRLMYNE